MNRTINQRELEQQLILHESLKLSPYRCPAGDLTIGVGRNLDTMGLTLSEKAVIHARKPDWKIGDDITTDEALMLLRNDLARVDRELTTHVPTYPRLTDRRQMALLDMCFNLGLARFLKFKDMLAALKSGDYRQAALEMLKSKWATQVGDEPGQRAHTLIQMMREG